MLLQKGFRTIVLLWRRRKKHLFVSNDKSMTCFRSFFGFFTTASHSNSKGLHKTHKIISSCMYFFSFFVKRVCLHFGYRLLIGCISGTGSQLIYFGKKLVFSTGNQLILAFFQKNNHHTWHLCVGFMGDFGGQLKALANSFELDRTPVTRYLAGE